LEKKVIFSIIIFIFIFNINNNKKKKKKKKKKKGKIRPFLRIYEGATLVYATATKESKESIKYFFFLFSLIFFLSFWNNKSFNFRSYLPLNDGVITFGLDLLLSEDVMIQCFHFSSTGVQKLFRCQFFAGCVSRNLLRYFFLFIF